MKEQAQQYSPKPIGFKVFLVSRPFRPTERSDPVELQRNATKSPWTQLLVVQDKASDSGPVLVDAGVVRILMAIIPGLVPWLGLDADATDAPLPTQVRAFH